MPIKTDIFSKDDLPDHLREEVNHYADIIFQAVAPLMKDAESLNFVMSALGWVSFLCIKEFVAEHHQERAVANLVKSISGNLETFKDRSFMKEAKEYWEKMGKI